MRTCLICAKPIPPERDVWATRYTVGGHYFMCSTACDALAVSRGARPDQLSYTDRAGFAATTMREKALGPR
jgi:ribosomal protein L24E